MKHGQETHSVATTINERLNFRIHYVVYYLHIIDE